MLRIPESKNETPLESIESIAWTVFVRKEHVDFLFKGCVKI
jgi:hypothetical protein